MAKLTLQILGDTKSQPNGIDNVIAKVKTDLKTLETPIRITIDSSGIDNLTRNLNDATRALQTALQNVQQVTPRIQNLGNVTDNLGERMRRGFTQVREAVTMAGNAELQRVRTYHDGISTTIRDVETLGQHITTTTSDFQRQARYMEEADAAYANYLREIESTRPNTALQNQIEAINGIGREFKSAEESAAFFTRNGLTPLEKELNTAAVQAGRLRQENQQLIDSQETWKDGQLIKAVDTYRDSLGNVTQVTSKLNGTTAETTVLTRQHSEVLKKQADSAELAAKKNSLLGDSIDRIIAKMTAWMLLGNAIASVIRSFREAIQTMQEVDTQLTNIAKVSNLSEAEIKAIGDSAYDAASKFGVAAEEYLSAVYTFQKAGLGKSATDMAELATKTMLVGDTTADVASKFLVAVNAAWELNGSMEALSKIVDQTDFVNNNYATDLKKLADGMPIVASTAANMNLSFEETLALLGTINSKTQETGRKTATAVRSFLIAISGQVGEFVDETGESFEVTTENVEALTDALKIYGNDAVKNAIATGEIINPMEALNSLAQAYRDNLLTDVELQDILINVAGKMRYNQLVTIVKDLASETSTYRDILSQLGNTAGTADAEVATMLGSWQAKTQILSNTWNQFISHLVETKAVKGALDVLTGLIKVLDSDFTKATIAIGLFTAALSLLPALIAKISIAFSALSVALSTNPLIWVAGAAIAIIGLIEAFDTLEETYEKQKKKLEEVEAEYDRLYGESSEYGNLKSRIDELTDAERIRLGVLEAEADELHRQVEEEQKRTFLAWRNARGFSYSNGTTRPDGSVAYIDEFGNYQERYVEDSYSYSLSTELDNARAKVNALTQEYESGKKTLAEYKQGLQEVVLALKDDAEAIQLGVDSGEELEAVEQSLLNLYNSIGLGLSYTTTETTNAANQSDALNIKLLDQVSIYNSLKEALDPLTAALGEMNDKGYMTEKTMQALIEAYPELQSEISITNKGFVISASALRENIEAQKAQYQTIYDNAASAAKKILDAESAKEAAIDRTTQSIENQLRALTRFYGVSMRDAALAAKAAERAGNIEEAASLWEESERYLQLRDNTREALWDLRSAKSNLDAANEIIDMLSTGDKVTDDKKTSLGSSSSKTTDPIVDAIKEEIQKRKDNIELLKSELSIMDERGDNEQDIIAKQREIQNALHEEADYLRSIEAYWSEVGVDQTDVNKLSLEWLQISNKIKKTLDDIVTNTLEALKDALGTAEEEALAWVDDAEAAAIAPLQAQLDILKAEQEAIEDSREEEEKLLAVEKARVALENAQNERNIRQYNAMTGQWEWVANASVVQKAREALVEAEEALADFYKKREIEALEKNIKSIQDSYNLLRDAIKDFAKEIKDGTLHFSDAMDYLLSKVQSAAESTRAQMQSAASQAASFFVSAGQSTVLDQMKANSQAWLAADAAGDEKAKQDLASQNLALGTSQGWKRGSDGVWRDANGNRTYDSGGILRGVGGIKATRRDEMIIPPPTTMGLLDAERNGAFDALLNHLGIVTAAANTIAGFGGAVTRNSIGSQHNGDVYEFEGISIGEAQARGMSVYDFAQLGRTLALQRGN